MLMNKGKKVVSITDAKEKAKTAKPEEAKAGEQQPELEPVYCSFCGRPNHLVIKMIKGPGVSICSECVMICVQYFILEDRIPAADVQKILDTFWRGAKQ
jgi:hypothetical protein